jgi:phosphoribosylglycinamide formyltransferase-1
MKKLIIFASGSGSNAENIIQYFRSNGHADVDMVLTPNPQAGVIERCRRLNVRCLIFTRNEWKSGTTTAQVLSSNPDLIILAGFMWLVPADFIAAFPHRIVNIHPALLPKFGGKGMYGDFVHRAVSQAGETETGITIHYVNEHYDEGQIIFQEKVAIAPGENPATIAAKVHELEYRWYPQVIKDVLDLQGL